MSKIMAQIMEGEISNVLPLALRRPSLEGAEPVVDAFFGQALAALGRKDIDTLGITRGLQVFIEGLARFVHQIDITPLAPLIAHMQPPYFWTDMSMGHLQPGDITDPAACPVAQGKERGPASIPLLLDQRAQDKALILRELARGEHLLWREIHPSGRIPLQ